jgi:DNA-binding response OmpR family regulator
MSQILIVEDEPRISAFIAKGLRAAGFTPLVESSGEAAVALALSEPIDLVVLDVGLPDIDGFEVLARLRGQGVGIPVVMLTARSSVADTVAGLEQGADDYMPKPFSFDELLARIRLRLKAVGGSDSASVLAHGDVSLDLRSRRLTVSGREVELTAREFALAETFLRNPGHVLSREQLLSRVWGYDFDPGSNVVDVYVRYLRQKLGAERLETVRGMGYRLRTPGD